MSKMDDAAGSESQLAEELEAPTYILHQYGPPNAEIENLPLYTAQHDPNAPITASELNNILCNPDRARENDVNIWRRYLNGSSEKKVDLGSSEKRSSLIRNFAMTIEAGQEDVMALLIENNLMTANTRFYGLSPLCLAVLQKNVRMVQQLIELGAEPNDFSGPVSW